MEDRDEGVCRVKVGLLFLRDCQQLATQGCAQCGRPVCEQHRMQAARGWLCPQCAANDPSYQGKPSAQRVRRRDSYYDEYHYQPYYYGHSHYFSDDDYRAFDREHQLDHEPPDRDRDAAPAAAATQPAGEAEDLGDDYDIDDDLES